MIGGLVSLFSHFLTRKRSLEHVRSMICDDCDQANDEKKRN